MVTGQGCGFGTGGCEGLCPAANRTWPGYTFSLSVSIKDRSLHMTLGKSQIIVPRAYLGMGAGKTCCSLVVDPALSRPTDEKRRWWRSLRRTESGIQRRGLGVQVWTGTWTPGTGEWWVSPACA